MGVGGRCGGSVKFGRLVNVDEVHAYFHSFGLVTEDSKKGASAHAVSPHIGSLNPLLQWREASRATKSSGSHGGGDTSSVSLDVGNIHPEVAIPMDAGQVGNHAGATKERILYYTGRPVPPCNVTTEEHVSPESHDA